MKSTFEYTDDIRVTLNVAGAQKIPRLATPLCIAAFALMNAGGVMGGYIDQVTGGLVAPLGVLSTSSTLGVGYGTGAGGAVTQITSSATGVTLNKVCGQITTVALSTAAGAEERFTVTNSAVAATDTIDVGTTYAGAGTPMLGVMNIGAGTFDIVVTNLHASAALNALMVINFGVNKRVAA